MARERRAKKRRRRGPSKTRGAAATEVLSGLPGQAGVVEPLQHWHPRRRHPPTGHLTPARVEAVEKKKEEEETDRSAGEARAREGRKGSEAKAGGG